MLDTFKSRLTAKFPKIKFSQKRIDTISEKLNKKFPDITDEAEHDKVIDDIYDEADLVEIVRLDEVLAKPAPQPQPAPATEPAPQPKSEIEELKELVKGLATTVQTLTSAQSKQSISAKVKERLKDVPEKFWSKRVQPEKEEDIEAFATEVNADYTEIVPKQQQGYQPGRASGTPNKATDKQINSLVDDLMGVQPQDNNN